MITCKSDREMNYMRDAGKLVALTHQEVAKAVKPDVTTKELDTICEDYIVKHGGKPAFKGLYGFPSTICASVNEEVVHGFPGLRKLINGDIISIDLGAEINGYNGDATQTLPVGEVSDEALRLLQVTEQSMYQGIDQAIVGNRLSDISHAVQEYAESNGFSVVRDYVGHGIGSKLHEDPQVPNYGHPGRGPRLKQGMTLAIEPMINVGTHEVQTLPNKWTVVTRDRKLSAHFEHTIAITEDVPEILTRL